MYLIVSNEKEIPRRRTLKANLTDSEARRFEQSHHPFSQVDALTEIVKWFSKQPWLVRKNILGDVPEGEAEDLARLLLERMADEQSRDSPGRQGRPGRAGRKRSA